jgi:uncharacterized protein YijF (DUF1287 family)
MIGEKYAGMRCRPGFPFTAVSAVLGTLVFLGPSPAAATGEFAAALSDAAIERTRHAVLYDPSYVKIPFPGGDVAANRGVCTDVVIRAYRALGIDLQALVHRDMSANFGLYPENWGMRTPDPNIDHRRVANLATFFSRFGQSFPVSASAESYREGDIVTWSLPRNRPHIGIVTDRRSADGVRPLIVHNIGAGPALEDMLFRFPITGHYRYAGLPPAERRGR